MLKTEQYNKNTFVIGFFLTVLVHNWLKVCHWYGLSDDFLSLSF